MLSFFATLFDSQLQGMVILDKFLALFVVPPLGILHGLVELDLLVLDLGFGGFEQSFGLEVQLVDSIQLVRLRLDLEPVFVLEVLLDPHLQNVLVDWQLHPLVQILDLLLSQSHLSLQSCILRLKLILPCFSRCNLLH